MHAIGHVLLGQHHATAAAALGIAVAFTVLAGVGSVIAGWLSRRSATARRVLGKPPSAAQWAAGLLFLTIAGTWLYVDFHG